MNTFSRHIARVLLFAAILVSANGHAALTDISNSPLASSGFTSVKPNLTFILDNSGSMAWDFMPDINNNPVFSTSKYGYASSQCNGVYYNPNTTYELPVDASGTAYSPSTFTAAKIDGYGVTTTQTLDLGTHFGLGPIYRHFANNIWWSAAYYYKYTGSQTTQAQKDISDSNSTFYKECNSSIGSSPGSGVFTKVTVSSTSGPGSTDERQNFANWYSYYRTRLLTMKSAAGLSFKNIGNSYRIGFSTISDHGVNSDDKTTCSLSSWNKTYLKIDDFDSLQKTCWYSKLYSTTTSGSTPLAGALSKAGQIYAGQLLSGADNPVEYSCQQNFALLSTDGFWNSNTSSYGPNQIDNSTTVGQQDGGEARPMYDGGSTSYTKSTSQTKQSQAQIQQTTSQLQKETTQIQKRTQQLQQESSVYQKVQGQLYEQTSSYYGYSWSDWSAVSTCNEDTSGRYQTQCIVGTLEERTSNNHGYNWTSWTPTSSCSTDHSGSKQTECQVTQNWVTAASCTATHTGSSGSYHWTGNGSAVDCQSTTTWSNVATCTGTCQTTDTGWVNASSCSASSSGGQTITCQTTDTGWVGASSCSASSSGGQVVTCQGPIVTGPTYVSSCTNQTGNSGNNWTTTSCSTTVVQAATPVQSCTPVSPSAGNNYTTTSCTTVTTGPTTVTSCVPASASASNSWTTTTCSNPVYSGGSSDSLADVAEYYWKTDLRTSALGNCTGALGADVCQNDVPGAGSDINAQQHMTTFTLGLGADGLVRYASDYLSGGSADFNAIKNGPDNWPLPVQNTLTTIDDLWHAAVDGRGVYYSAKDASTLVSGLSSALAGVTARLGSSAAAATSSLEPVAGDNYLFIAQFETGSWTGDLQARSIDIATGDISVAPIWSAQSVLDGMVSASSDTRTIYTFTSDTATYPNKLKPFLWANLTGSEQAYFSNICLPTALLSQCPTLSAADQAAASGANLVNYLRGQKGNGGTLYRARTHALGDMVNSQPQYVKTPPFSYTDAGYSAFKSANASRTSMVYEAANDGMLHAFDAVTGIEDWAYIPPMILGNMYRLAENTYASNHRFYVDGSPIAGDVCPNAPATACAGSDWKTLLVGGLNEGGRGYYALDITDPAAPKALWTFSSADDSDLGYTYGNPIIVKRGDGTWVVVVSSGYNNVSPGDGQGYIYVLNAYTGQLLEKIGTGVGSTGSPSGLGKINVWLNATTDKTALRFYGGDLLGNLWRLTLDQGTPPASPVSTAGTAFQLAQVGQINGAGNQPITTKPELTVVTYAGTSHNVVEFGTGEYLGLTDLLDTSQQSIYAIKDDLGTTSLGQVRTPGVLVQQTLTSSTGSNGQETRTVSNNAVDWGTKAGWYVDLNPSNMSPGERVNIDVQLNLGLLTVATNVPSNDACSVGGYAYLYYFDFKTGSYPSTVTDQTVGSRDPDNALVAGMNFVYLQTPSGELTGVNIICTTDASCHVDIPPPPPPPSGGVKLYSWRELVQ